MSYSDTSRLESGEAGDHPIDSIHWSDLIAVIRE